VKFIVTIERDEDGLEVRSEKGMPLTVSMREVEVLV